MTRPCLTEATMPAEAGFGEHHAGGRFGDLGRRGNGDSDLRLAQRRRIVGAVAAHADGVTAVLIRLDELELVLGQDAGEDGVVFGPDRVGIGPGGRSRLRARPTARRWRPSPARRPSPSPCARPDACSSLTRAAESARGGSLNAMRPTNFIALGAPAATASTRKPCPSSSLAIASAVGEASASAITTA